MQFTLRPWTINDLDSLVEQGNNAKIAAFMNDAFPHPYTRDAGQAFIEKVSAASPLNVFAIDVDGKAVGGIGVFQQADVLRKSAELGYWLGEAYWGRGIVTAAVKQMVDIGFSIYDITRIYARPFGHNIASQKVLEKAGFTLEAHIADNIFKEGVYRDELIYAVRRPL